MSGQLDTEASTLNVPPVGGGKVISGRSLRVTVAPRYEPVKGQDKTLYCSLLESHIPGTQ